MNSKLAPFLNRFARKRELWWQFTTRAVEVRHRGSYLGAVWLVLNPLLMLALYVTVFGFIFGSRFRGNGHESPREFALAVFLGLSLFHVLSETISAAPSLIIGNPNLVKKVVFPLEILPLANVSAYWFHFLINMALLFVGSLVVGHPVSLTGLLWMPVILIPHVLLTLGIGWFVSALGVFFRDVAQITQVVAQITLYASAIFYSTSLITGSYWQVLKWNPLLHTVELSRQALLWNQPLNLNHLGYTWATGVITCLIGYLFFKKTKHAFADVI
ncbi:MAG: ABC transporter permease [Verrucomicrobia bacterium]|nr:ABC transporter permease [Verrucomicrobiota bacterium]